jgi:uncharacterized protein (TIGR01244 family)
MISPPVTLTFNWLNQEVATSAQLQYMDVVAVGFAGFRSLINNRPDFEGGPDQPNSIELEAMAHKVGMEYAFLPVSGAYQSPEEAAALAKLLDTLPKPILLFCRSGARSKQLYHAACAQPKKID